MVTWQQAQTLALSLPEAQERDHFGGPSYRVRGKIFAQLSAPGAVPEQALVKLALADQAALCMSAPDTFSLACHWGRHGWTYIRLANVDKAWLHALLLKSWQGVATKTLVAGKDHGP